MAAEVPIPKPPGLPIVGNVTDIDPTFPLGSFLNLSEKYGEIFKLTIFGNTINVVSSQALAHELCDEKRFKKHSANATLTQISNGVHDGLFTAATEAHAWGVAHRVLVPAFGPMDIHAMFPEMHEIASQLALKWARHGSQRIMVTDDFTRLTLDTLALCSMNYRFNSFYHDEMHPFINAMGDFLTECGARAFRPGITSIFYRQANKKYWEDIEILRKTAEGVLIERKANPSSDRKDLLGAMLQGIDPKTKEKVSDSSIIDNLITFLIAGHETTSGMLSFAFYQMLRHPEVYRKAQEEVDNVIGTGAVKAEHLSKLPYVSAVLKETLRHTPTINGFGLTPKDHDELIGGKYHIKMGETVFLLLAKIQKDPMVFGDDAEEFQPERMLDENFNRLMKEYPDCWKPFGNGARACIGRPFAWQEAVLVMAMLLQNFNFFFDDPSYQLAIKQTLTIKPKGFNMRAMLRDGLTATALEHRLTGEAGSGLRNGTSPSHPKAAVNGVKQAGKPLKIYYGSNTGTCESLAQRLAADAASHGFAAVIDPLDAARQNLPSGQPVVFITASYEGQPPDNANLFCDWITSVKGAEFKGIPYAVFGCGHRDWSQTFHRIPRLVDTTMEAQGGTRICPLGLADAYDGQILSDFEQWEDDVFWPAMAGKYGGVEDSDNDKLSPNLSIELSTPRSSTLRQDVREANVISAEVLTAPGAPVKKHVEFELPSDISYRAGDYLAILPINPKESVARVLRHFHLAWDANLTIRSQGPTMLPTNVPVPVADVLGAYVELAQPATKRNILSLIEAAKDEHVKARLQELAGDAYTNEVSLKRVSLLDLLERFPTVALPLGTFLALLPPMRVRQYSISSSPLWKSTHATLTYTLLDEPALSDPVQRHTGVASSYLTSLRAGDKVNLAIRQSHAAFHLPIDPEKTPIICICAGAGLAPFRGFIQERAAQIGTGRKLAPALLFFGCRTPGVDDLYREEFEQWQTMGAVDMRRCYSRVDEGMAEAEEAKGCKHVNDRLWRDRADVLALWEKGAKMYVCGSRSIGEAVKNAVVRIWLEKEPSDENMSEEERRQKTLKWFDSIRNERYTTDVFD
ncbi:cytochrome P450 [Thozetella sp. PMI_491]|nr:cytochrome P450 [Thozetella sp. PMI_491]